MSYFTVDELRIASPCEVPWSAMNGDDVVRHCTDCKKNVYNLSLLTRAEANKLIVEKEGNLCVSFYKRFDGTVLTADCPVGLRAIRVQYLKTRAKFIGFALAIWATVAGSSSCSPGAEVIGIPPKQDSSRVVNSTNPD